MYIISTIHIFCTSVLASSMHDENVYSYCWGTLCFVFLQRGVLDSFVAASAFSLILAYWGLLLYLLCFKAVSLSSDGKAFTRRLGRESTRRSERIPGGGEKQGNVRNPPTLLILPICFSIHPLFYSPPETLESQGALAVLKQFLESNLVRIFHILKRIMFINQICAGFYLIFLRNT